MREIITKRNRTNIKYTIVRCKINANDIKSVKICKNSQKQDYSQLQITVN